MRIGKRIYFDIETGNIILDTGERVGAVVKTTIEQDITSYKVLNERNRESYDYIELEYGQYAQEFTEASGYKVNPETKELEFSHPDPNQPDEPQIYHRALS